MLSIVPSRVVMLVVLLLTAMEGNARNVELESLSADELYLAVFDLGESRIELKVRELEKRAKVSPSAAVASPATLDRLLEASGTMSTGQRNTNTCVIRRSHCARLIKVLAEVQTWESAQLHKFLGWFLSRLMDRKEIVREMSAALISIAENQAIPDASLVGTGKLVLRPLRKKTSGLRLIGDFLTIVASKQELPDELIDQFQAHLYSAEANWYWQEVLISYLAHIRKLPDTQFVRELDLLLRAPNLDRRNMIDALTRIEILPSTEILEFLVELMIDNPQDCSRLIFARAGSEWGYKEVSLLIRAARNMQQVCEGYQQGSVIYTLNNLGHLPSLATLELMVDLMGDDPQYCSGLRFARRDVEWGYDEVHFLIKAAQGMKQPCQGDLLETIRQLRLPQKDALNSVEIRSAIGDTLSRFVTEDFPDESRLLAIALLLHVSRGYEFSELLKGAALSVVENEVIQGHEFDVNVRSLLSAPVFDPEHLVRLFEMWKILALRGSDSYSYVERGIEKIVAEKGATDEFLVLVSSSMYWIDLDTQIDILMEARAKQPLPEAAEMRILESVVYKPAPYNRKLRAIRLDILENWKTPELLDEFAAIAASTNDDKVRQGVLELLRNAGPLPDSALSQLRNVAALQDRRNNRGPRSREPDHAAELIVENASVRNAEAGLLELAESTNEPERVRLRAIWRLISSKKLSPEIRGALFSFSTNEMEPSSIRVTALRALGADGLSQAMLTKFTKDNNHDIRRLAWQLVERKFGIEMPWKERWELYPRQRSGMVAGVSSSILRWNFLVGSSAFAVLLVFFRSDRLGRWLWAVAILIGISVGVTYLLVIAAWLSGLTGMLDALSYFYAGVVFVHWAYAIYFWQKAPKKHINRV